MAGMATATRRRIHRALWAEELEGRLAPAAALLPHDASGQVFYLDFDGAEDVTYDGPVVVRDIDVSAFQGNAELIAAIASRVQEILAPLGVTVTSRRPETGEYSTIYVGGTDGAFAEYGDFDGLAEKVDAGNTDHSDLAFVFSDVIGSALADAREAVSTVSTTIAHEAGHLLGFDHSDGGVLAGVMLPLVERSNGVLDDVAHKCDVANGTVHQWIAWQAALFYTSQFVGANLLANLGTIPDSVNDGHIPGPSTSTGNDLLEGTYEEDTIGVWLNHFVAGADVLPGGDELSMGLEPVLASAYERAEGLWNDYISASSFACNPATTVYWLGRVAHLLADMSVPAHVHNDPHGVRDTYEDEVAIGNYFQNFGMGTANEPYGSIAPPSTLENLFRLTADYTEDYDSNDGNGDTPAEYSADFREPGRHRPDLVDNTGGVIDAAEVAYLANDLMPWAIEQTAALFRLFYSYVDLTPATVRIDTPNLSIVDSNPTHVGSNFTVSAQAEDPQSGVDKDGYHFITQRCVAPGVWEDTKVWEASGYTGTIGLTANGVYRIRATAENGAGNTGQSRWYYIEINDAPIQGHDISFVGLPQWNDDNADDPNGVIEGLERVQMNLALRSSSSVTNVEAVLSSSVSTMHVTDSYVAFGDITAGAQSAGDDDFDMQLEQSSYASCPFTLHVTYAKAGVNYCQDFTFSRSFADPGSSRPFFVVDHIVWREAANGDGDGILESGEDIGYDVYLKNIGSSGATNVKASIVDVPEFLVPEVFLGYPDLAAHGTAQKAASGEFEAHSVPRDFAGTVVTDVIVTYGETTQHTFTIENAVLFDIGETPWLQIDSCDFGVSPTSSTMTTTVTVHNRGTDDLHVTGATPSSGDTSVLSALPWTIAPGESRDIQIRINTPASQGPMTRYVDLVSDSHAFADTRINVTGVVNDYPATYQVPGVTNGRCPDVSGSRIVWEESYDIFGYDMISGAVYTICADPASQIYPKIGGSLVAWDDGRASSGDVYAYDLATGTTYAVATTGANEYLIGVDGNRVAFTRSDFTYTSYGSQYEGYNVYYYDISTGLTTQVTTYSAVPGSSLSSAPGSSPVGGDFDDGLVTWLAEEHAWIGGGNDWNSGVSSSTIVKYQIGIDGAPVLLDATGVSDSPTTADGRVVWAKKDAADPEDIQLWMWDGTTKQITTEAQDPDTNHRRPVLGADCVVYEDNSAYRLNWCDFDPATTTVGIVRDTDPAGIRPWRMDGHCLVWAESGIVYYAYVNQADIAVGSADIAFSNENPDEGSTMNVTVTARNLMTIATAQNITVRLYDGDPDADGIQLGTDQVIAGLAGRGNAAVTFSSIPTGMEGTRSFYVTVSVPGEEHVTNNKASRALNVRDTDTQGPVISGVVVAEYNGDGDGIIGSDEQVRISWALADPSGIGSTWVTVDGQMVAASGGSGNYEAILAPLSVANHIFIIGAIDDDTSPAPANPYSGSFTVVTCETITILDHGVSLVNGSPLATYVGAFLKNDSNPGYDFTIRNDGQQALDLGAIVAPAGYTITGPATNALAPGATTQFVLTLATGNLGRFMGPVSVSSSDADASPFTFNVTGNVIEPLILSKANSRVRFYDADHDWVQLQFAGDGEAWVATVNGLSPLVDPNQDIGYIGFRNTTSKSSFAMQDLDAKLGSPNTLTAGRIETRDDGSLNSLRFLNTLGTLRNTEISLGGNLGQLAATGAITDAKVTVRGDLTTARITGLSTNVAYQVGGILKSGTFTGGITGGLLHVVGTVTTLSIGGTVGNVTNGNLDFDGLVTTFRVLGNVGGATTLDFLGDAKTVQFSKQVAGAVINVTGRSTNFKVQGGLLTSTVNLNGGAEAVYLYGGLTGDAVTIVREPLDGLMSTFATSGGIGVGTTVTLGTLLNPCNIKTATLTGGITGGDLVVFGNVTTCTIGGMNGGTATVNGTVTTCNVSAAVDNGADLHVTGAVTNFKVTKGGVGVNAASTVRLDGDVTTVSVIGDKGLQSIANGSSVRIGGALLKTLTMSGILAGRMEIVGAATATTMTITGDMAATGQLMANVFGNVTINGTFSGAITAALDGTLNTLTVKTGGGGYTVTPGDAFAIYKGIPHP